MKVNNETPRQPLGQKAGIDDKSASSLRYAQSSSQEISNTSLSDEREIFLNKTSVIAKDLPDIDKERVNELKRRIAQGEYKLEPEKIAQGVILNSIQEDI